MSQINKSNVEHDGAPFTTETVNKLIERLEQAATMNLVPMPHTFIPTETITHPTIVATRARVKALRSAREKHAQDARDSVQRWNETQEAERKMMWTQQKQEEDWKSKTVLSIKQK